MDKMENKTVLLWCYSHVISCDEWFLQTRNHKWEVEHFVCWISTGRDEEKDLYKSIVWPFHSQDLTMTWWESDTLSVPELVFSFWDSFILWTISFHLSWRLKRYLFIPPHLLLPMFFFSISGRGLNGIKRFSFSVPS